MPSVIKTGQPARSRCEWDKVGTNVKTQGQKGWSNDCSGTGRRGKSRRVERARAQTRVVVRPTMKTENAAGLQSRHTTDALRVTERADAAWHDVAQYHLHEFGGERQ